jgi:L-fuconolactonase
MPIIDAHQHFWNLKRVSYPWLTAAGGPICRNFEPPDLIPQLAAAGVEATVVVQAMDSADDTAYLLEQAGKHPFIAAVVGWVPLDRPDDAAAALDRYLSREYGGARFAGVRHLIHEEADPDWLLRDRVIDGLRVLAERDISFDVVAQVRHLRHVPVLAERVPGLRMVIDHLGKPEIAAGHWEPWASLLRAAAECPGVHAKISGLGTEANPDTWTAPDLQPYVDHAIEIFGPDRLMFGSDWPVSVLAGGYSKVWAETARVLAGLSADDRAAIYGGTAVRFYGLQADGLG